MTNRQDLLRSCRVRLRINDQVQNLVPFQQFNQATNRQDLHRSYQVMRRIKDQVWNLVLLHRVSLQRVQVVSHQESHHRHQAIRRQIFTHRSLQKCRVWNLSNLQLPYHRANQVLFQQLHRRINQSLPHPKILLLFQLFNLVTNRQDLLRSYRVRLRIKDQVQNPVSFHPFNQVTSRQDFLRSYRVVLRIKDQVRNPVLLHRVYLQQVQVVFHR